MSNFDTKRQMMISKPRQVYPVPRAAAAPSPTETAVKAATHTSIVADAMPSCLSECESSARKFLPGSDYPIRSADMCMCLSVWSSSSLCLFCA
jgi:hypothetical protein